MFLLLKTRNSKLKIYRSSHWQIALSLFFSVCHSEAYFVLFAIVRQIVDAFILTQTDDSEL